MASRDRAGPGIAGEPPRELLGVVRGEPGDVDARPRDQPPRSRIELAIARRGTVGAVQLRSTSDAADALSRSAEHLWRGLPGFQWRCSLRAWAHRVARNAALQ